MRVVWKQAWPGFIKRHSGARNALLAWKSLAQACLAHAHNDLKQTFADVDYAPPSCTGFVSMWAATGSGSSRRFTTTGSRHSFAMI